LSTVNATWNMTVQKRDLVEAIGVARRRATLRGDGFNFESDVILSAGEDGLSVRSSNSAMDIPGSGVWSSPIRANGASMRRLAPKLSGPEIRLSYADGHLALNQTNVPAGEV
jgi:hypothetical protein